MLKEVETRLFETLKQLATKAETIALDLNMVDSSLQTSPNLDPTDKLILISILNHARLHITNVKVFLSGNTNDFGRREVQEALQDVGINQYFSSTQAFLDWLKSQIFY